MEFKANGNGITTLEGTRDECIFVSKAVASAKLFGRLMLRHGYPLLYDGDYLTRLGRQITPPAQPDSAETHTADLRLTELTALQVCLYDAADRIWAATALTDEPPTSPRRATAMAYYDMAQEFNAPVRGAKLDLALAARPLQPRMSVSQPINKE